MRHIVLVSCALLCGCDYHPDGPYQGKLQSNAEQVPLPSSMNYHDYKVQVATLNELRQIKVELQKINASMEKSQK